MAQKLSDAQLLDEVERLRARVKELESAELRHEQMEKALIEADAAIRESEDRYRALYEHIPLMYFTLDSEGTVLSVNSHGARQLGYEQSELVGRSVLVVFHEEDRSAVAEQLRASVGRPGVVARWQFRKIRKDGSLLWVQEAVRTVVTAKNEIVVLVVCEDVTERKEAEERLIHYQEKLRNLTSELTLTEERERRRLSVDLHDHIGQTLAMARMKLGELRGSQPSADEAQRVEEVRKLIEESILATRSLTFELSSPLLYELGLEAAIDNLAQQFQRDSADSVRFTFVSDGRPKPLSDETSVLLFRVVRELAFNIVKHAQASEATISVARSQDRIRITIEDNGIGLDQSKIADDNRFGLFSARERLDHIGGRLEFEATRRKGTRAVIVAPLDGGEGAER